MSISPLGTKKRCGQAGLNAVLKETIGHPSHSFSPFKDNGKVLISMAKKSVKRSPFDILYCPLAP